MHEVLERIDKYADEFAATMQEAEDLGRLPDANAERMREIGVVRMLQPADLGGLETHPVDFLEAVMRLGSYSGPAGWVAGVVGLHAWEVAQMERSVQEQVWGENPDTWVASPYTPMGRARRVDGGFVFNGRWQFSSGTDHCRWAFLGGLELDVDNPKTLHFLLPRGDYEVIDGTWDVMGLMGTGSKDVEVKDAFVPFERVVVFDDLFHGVQADKVGREGALYRLPYIVMFPAAITAQTLGIAEGALASFVAWSRERVTRNQGRISQNPYQLATLGAAAADIQASRLQVLDDVARVFDDVAAGREISIERRLEVRRNQVRASRRAVEAVDQLFIHAGGTAIRRGNPLQHFWRDAHAALNHVTNVSEPIYQGYGLNLFGHEVPASLRMGPATRER
ncbi:acyl-CoA dehydrogenase family protein [Nonomuraea wenchangensis]|uniref:acyl-CoA dehydrogenase family protein n=1 Tax=Nonomuraea wenchangensis TaxID=568860 RepID=UPI00332BA217